MLFRSRGYGVSVHRKDCPNASITHQKAEPGRWIHVSWGEDVNMSYATSLEVVCKDRNNLLVDISTALSSCKVGVSNMNVRTTSDGFAIFYITIHVADSGQLGQVMTKLNNISDVKKVTRSAG